MWTTTYATWLWDLSHKNLIQLKKITNFEIIVVSSSPATVMLIAHTNEKRFDIYKADTEEKVHEFLADIFEGTA